MVDQTNIGADSTLNTIDRRPGMHCRVASSSGYAPRGLLRYLREGAEGVDHLPLILNSLKRKSNENLVGVFWGAGDFSFWDGGDTFPGP